MPPAVHVPATGTVLNAPDLLRLVWGWGHDVVSCPLDRAHFISAVPARVRCGFEHVTSHTQVMSRRRFRVTCPATLARWIVLQREALVHGDLFDLGPDCRWFFAMKVSGR